MKILILCANDFNFSLLFVSQNDLEYQAFKNYGADFGFRQISCRADACQVLLVKQQQK